MCLAELHDLYLSHILCLADMGPLGLSIQHFRKKKQI